MTFEEYSFDSVNTINRINTKTQTSCSFIPILIILTNHGMDLKNRWSEKKGLLI